MSVPADDQKLHYYEVRCCSGNTVTVLAKHSDYARVAYGVRRDDEEPLEVREAGKVVWPAPKPEEQP
jgi:hypothetical protein